MKNSAYWKKRYEQLEKASFQKGVQFYQRLDDQYVIASNQIDKEIRAWYQRFATNNKVSITEAKKLLNNQELKELKWTVNEYIKYGEENSIDGMFMKQLENASARYHISKLEALKLNTQCIIEQLYGNQTDQMTSFIKDVYTDNMFHSMYELQKGFNIGWNFSGIDEKKLEKLISKPWAVDGINFSDRIWQNKQKLINELNNELTSMCLTGKSPDIAIENIAKKMDVSKSRAKALVYTESSYFQSQSDRDTLKDFGCEKYEVLATLDSITSEICREMDGKVFDLNDYEVGVSAPPFHPHCRTVIVPAFDDDFDIGERAARDADGKTYYVPDDITYPEWKKAFVDGEHEGYTEFTKEGKKHFEKKNGNDIINLDDSNLSKLKQSKLNKDDYDEYIQLLNNHSNLNIKQLYVNYADDIGEIRYFAGAGCYNPNVNRIEFSIPSQRYIDNGQSKFSTLAHEYGHYFDDYKLFDNLTYDEIDFLNDEINLGTHKIFKKRPSSSDAFLKALREDKENIRKIFSVDMKKDLFSSDASAGVQDAISGMFTKSGMRWIHEESYYNRTYNSLKFQNIYNLQKDLQKAYKKLGFDASNQTKVKMICRNYETASEMWANIMSAEVNGGKELEYIKKYLPKSYEAFIEIIKGVKT